MKPLYQHYRRERAVYAPDFPGYGFSDRSARMYTPRLMTDAIHAILAVIRRNHGALPVDAICAVAVLRVPGARGDGGPGGLPQPRLREPDRFQPPAPEQGPPASTLGLPAPAFRAQRPAWVADCSGCSRAAAVIRYFLRRTWGSKDIDAGLLDYDYLITRLKERSRAAALFERVPVQRRQRHAVRGARASDLGRAWCARGFRRLPAVCGEVADRANWTIEVLPTGALPHFEMPAQFVRRYENWAARLEPTRT